MRLPAVLLAVLALAATPVLAQPPALAGLPPSITAVVGEGAERALLLTETEFGVSATRRLGLGEEYRDGWRLTAIDGITLVLEQAGRRESVRLPEHLSGGAAAAPELTGSLAMTNAAAPGANRPRVFSTIEAAVTGGDPDAVFAMGGSEQQALAALRTKLTAGGQRRYDAVLDRFANLQPGERIIRGYGEDGSSDVLMIEGPGNQPSSVIMLDGRLAGTPGQAGFYVDPTLMAEAMERPENAPGNPFAPP